MRTLLVTFLLCAFTMASSQIVVTHFNAPWNNHNKADWVGELKGCEITYVDISNSPLICKKHKIKAVPTIIVFSKGKEVHRVHGGISFRVNKEEIEGELQEIILRLQPYSAKNPVL